MSAENAKRPELQNKIIAVIGRKGSGKSTMLAERLKRAERVLVFDPMDEHGSEHGFLPNRLETIPEVENFMRWNRKRGAWAASYVPDENLDDEIEAVARIVYERGDLTFGVEEIPLICSPSYLPPILGKLIRTGRHRSIDLAWTAQRASEVSRTLTSLTDEFVLFSQTEPRDLDAIGERCGNDVARKVAELGRHDFVIWDVGARRLTEHGRNPETAAEKAARSSQKLAERAKLPPVRGTAARRVLI